MYKIVIRNGQIISSENLHGKTNLKITGDGSVIEFDDRILVRCQKISPDRYISTSGHDIILTIQEDIFTDIKISRNERYYSQTSPEAINKKKTVDIFYPEAVIYRVSISEARK